MFLLSIYSENDVCSHQFFLLAFSHFLLDMNRILSIRSIFLFKYSISNAFFILMCKSSVLPFNLTWNYICWTKHMVAISWLKYYLFFAFFLHLCGWSLHHMFLLSIDIHLAELNDWCWSVCIYMFASSLGEYIVLCSNNFSFLNDLNVNSLFWPHVSNRTNSPNRLCFRFGGYAC